MVQITTSQQINIDTQTCVIVINERGHNYQCEQGCSHNFFDNIITNFAIRQTSS